MEESRQQGEQTNQVVQPLTLDEQAYACLAHFLQLSTWFIGPLVVYLAKRDSRFVSFHAMQALLLQGFMFVLWMGFMVILFSSVLWTFPTAGETSSPPQGFPVVLLFFPLLWLLGMGGWVLVIVLSIVYGIKAIRGQWAEYPILGRWARRIIGA